MELVIVMGLVLAALVGAWFLTKRNTTKIVEPEAPYKVEVPTISFPIIAEVAPEPAKCGCGRSPTGFSTGLHKLSDAEWAAKQAPAVEVAPVVAEVVPAVESSAPKAKKTSTKKATTDKPKAEPKKTVRTKADAKATGIRRVK